MAKSVGKRLHSEFFPLRIERNRGITSRRGDGVAGTVGIAGAGAVLCRVPACERIPGADETVGVQGGGVSSCDLLGSGAAASGAVAVKVDGERAGGRTDTPHREPDVLVVEVGIQATTVVVQVVLAVTIVSGS